MPPGTDMERGALALWTMLGLFGCAAVLVMTLVRFLAQFREERHTEDTRHQ